MQRAVDENDRKAAKKDQKKAKKTDAAQKAALDAANKKTGNGNSDSAAKDANASDNTDTTKDVSPDTDAPPSVPDTPATRGATAVANALARHPQVDLDTALENHHATAGIPKQNLTHEQIYDAITAEANFQKRQAIIQSRLPQEDQNAPEDNDRPKSRSP